MTKKEFLTLQISENNYRIDVLKAQNEKLCARLDSLQLCSKHNKPISVYKCPTYKHVHNIDLEVEGCEDCREQALRDISKTS